MRILRRLLLVWLTLWGSAVLAALVLKRRSEPVTDPTAPSFELASIFDGTEFRPTTGRLEDSNALTYFGGTSIDLRRAALADGRARLRLVTIMGGTDVTVPDTWRVTVEGMAIAGGHDVRVSDPATLPADSPHLVLDARTVMGGLRVTSRPVISAARDETP